MMTSHLRHRAVQVLSWAMVATVVLGALALIVVPRVNDAKPLTVLSGSMTGTYDIGDVVIVRPVDPETLSAGEVITFQPVSDDPRLTTHRIQSVTYGSDGIQFITKGDANGAADPEPITAEQVQGEVWYSVPKVGYVSVWLAGDTMRHLKYLLALGLILFGGWTLATGIAERRRERRTGPEVTACS